MAVKGFYISTCYRPLSAGLLCNNGTGNTAESRVIDAGLFLALLQTWGLRGSGFPCLSTLTALHYGFLRHPILAKCQSAHKTSWQERVNMVSWVINQSATATDSTSFINALLNRSLSCLPCLQSFFFPLSCFWIKKEISARQNCILSVLLKISIAETVICHPNSLSIPDCFSFSFLQAGEGRRAALTTGSHEFFVPRLMERYSAAPPSYPNPPATLKWHLTPSCVYIRPVEVRNSDESLWLCVYTLESRKEGNQPRSAKSGEVRENSCSAPELQWFTSARQDLSHVISTAETFDQHKTATVTALSTGEEKKKKATQKTEAARPGVESGRCEETTEFSVHCFHHLHLHQHGQV